MEKEAVITYETIFELLRREKNREELQKLDDNFINDVKAYLGEKKQLSLSTATDIFSEVEKEKNERLLSNVKKILKELYERREKKILTIAMNKSKSNASVVDTSVLLTHEKEMFNEFANTLTRFRGTILQNMLTDKPFETKELKKDDNDINKAETGNLEVKKEEQEPKSADSGLLIRFLHSVPKFVGPNLEVYGPFEQEDVASLPEDIATVLIRKSRAEEIKNN